MKVLLTSLLTTIFFSTMAMAYEVANIGLANTMVCSYDSKYSNGKKIVLPEFEKELSFMKVYKKGRVIIAPKGTKYTYQRVGNDGVMVYSSKNNKYMMLVYPTRRGQSVGGNMHNYTEIHVGKDAKNFASGSCRLLVQ